MTKESQYRNASDYIRSKIGLQIRNKKTTKDLKIVGSYIFKLRGTLREKGEIREKANIMEFDSISEYIRYAIKL